MARQRLGQHLLADLDWREQIARAIRVSPHSTVPLLPDDQHSWVEIGAGHGEMTRHLLAAGGPVTAIELDRCSLADFAALGKSFPNSRLFPPTFSRPTLPCWLPAGTCAFTATFPTTSAHRSC